VAGRREKDTVRVIKVKKESAKRITGSNEPKCEKPYVCVDDYDCDYDCFIHIQYLNR
jgi:hypothetical protein